MIKEGAVIGFVRGVAQTSAISGDTIKSNSQPKGKSAKTGFLIALVA